MSASSVDYGGDAMQEQRESALAIAEWGGGGRGAPNTGIKKRKKREKKNGKRKKLHDKE